MTASTSGGVNLNSISFLVLTFSFGIKYVLVFQFIFSYLNAKISDILRPVSEKRYVDKNKDHAQKALDKFTSATTLLLEEEIIDVEVVEDKFSAIKKLYPNASDKQINEAMKILEIIS